MQNGTARLYVGNLPYTMTPERLVEIFTEHGFPGSAPYIVSDRETGQSKGFGFIEVDASNCDQAIATLNGAEADGRSLRVDRAHDKPR